MQRLSLLAMISAAALASATAPAAVAAGPPYGQIEGVADVDRIFDAIRADIVTAQGRADLTRLYRRAGYLVTLTYSRPWRVKFGDQLPNLREEARRQFEATVQDINRRAQSLGLDADYDERRGH
jgi:hypothetical protein